ncbi:MAG: hemerythrin domain-containing protein [Burkholderiales bacterium]
MGIIKQQWNKITGQKDAIQLLKEDHQEVDKLFKQFESAKDETDKQKILRKVCEELIVHARIEEDLFYPAVRQVLDAKDVMDEAEVEHQSLKQLIAELGAMQPKDDLYDAKVMVLSEYVKHHVKEEQDEMFPKVEKADIDLNALGEELYLLKQDLKKQLASHA